MPPRRALAAGRRALVPLLLLLLAPAAGAGDLATALLDEVNRARTDAGLAPLAAEPRLMRAADEQAQAMAGDGTVAHDGAAGSFQARLAGSGYAFRSAAENLAAGQATPAAVLAGWQASPRHRRNLLLPDAVHAGTGHARRPAGAGVGYPHYWVLIVAAPARP